MLTFGESLLTSKPAPSTAPTALLADGCTAQLQAVGGAEMNTAVALARTGCSAGWVSVLPHGPLGDLVARVARERDRRVHLGAADRLQLRRAAVGQERGWCC